MPPNVDKAYQRTERILDTRLAAEKKAMARALKKTEQEIIDTLAELRSPGGDITARNSLARAVAYQKKLIKIVNQEYGSAYEQYSKNLQRITAAVEAEYGALDLGLIFEGADKRTLTSLRGAINAEFSALGDYMVTEVTRPLFDNILAGGSFKSLVDTIEGLLFEGGKGRVAGVAERKVHDTLMGYYQNNQLIAARRTGIRDFIYYGNIIATTRDFCARRAGQIYSVKEIKQWNELKWQGKKPGSVFINRGGYNCRHTLHPVKRRWVKEGRIKVQDIGEET